MPATTRTDPFAEVAQLSAELRVCDENIAITREQVTELEARRTTLRTRAEELRLTQPSPAENIDQALVDAMVANPDATPNADAIAHEVATIREARDVWDTNVSLVTRASTTIDGEIAAVGITLQAQQHDRAVAWSKFVIAAHSCLLASFRDRFAALMCDVIEPMVALSAGQDANGREIIGAHIPKLDRRSSVKIDAYEDGRSRAEELFTASPKSGAIERFRAHLVTLIDHAG